MCNSQQNFNITDNNINQMTVELVDLQLQAFMNQTNANFGTGKNFCIILQRILTLCYNKINYSQQERLRLQQPPYCQ